MRDEARIPLDSYHETPPFATMTDLVPAGVYRLTSMGLANTVEQWSDWLAPNVMEWEEIASVRLPDGTTFSGGLYVDYYDVKSTWLARQVFREYRWSDARKGDLLPLPDLGIDEAIAYLNDVHMPTLLLRQGSKVMRAMLFQTSETYLLSLEVWAQRLADSIR